MMEKGENPASIREAAKQSDGSEEMKILWWRVWKNVLSSQLNECEREKGEPVEK